MANTGPARNVLRIEIAGDAGVSGGNSGRSNGGGKTPPPPGPSNPWTPGDSANDNYRMSRGGMKNYEWVNDPAGPGPSDKARTRADKRYRERPAPPGAERADRSFGYRNDTSDPRSKEARYQERVLRPELIGLKGDYDRRDMGRENEENFPLGGQPDRISGQDYSLRERRRARKKKDRDAAWKNEEFDPLSNFFSSSRMYEKRGLPNPANEAYKNDLFSDGPTNSLAPKTPWWMAYYGLGDKLTRRYLGTGLKGLRAGLVNPLTMLPLAGLALKKTSDYFIDRGEKLAKFSPDITVARVQANMTRFFADMREAQALGPGIGRLIEAEAELTVAIRDMILPLKKLVVEELADLVKALSWIARLVEGGVNIGDYLPEGGKKVWEGIKKGFDWAGYFNPVWGASKLFRLLFRWLDKQLETQKDDPFGIFQKMVDGVRLAPEGAGERFSPRAWWSPEIERKPMGVQ